MIFTLVWVRSLFLKNELPNVDLRKQIQHNQIMVEALKKKEA